MIQALETEYAGHKFRSRLEARYAVFFDHLRIKWEYEPQGYQTAHGPYLPDFLLHLREPTLFEVKPWPGPSRDPRWEAVSNVASLVVARGMPHVNAIDECGPEDEHYEMFMHGGGWDAPHAFCVCRTCGKAGIEHSARGARICRHDDRDKGYSGNHPRVIDAYRAALAARFEHGDRPEPGPRQAGFDKVQGSHIALDNGKVPTPDAVIARALGDAKALYGPSWGKPAKQ